MNFYLCCETGSGQMGRISKIVFYVSITDHSFNISDIYFPVKMHFAVKFPELQSVSAKVKTQFTNDVMIQNGSLYLYLDQKTNEGRVDDIF